MKGPLTALVLSAATVCQGGEAVLHVLAPRHAGQAVLLYRYDDLLTLRTVRIGEAVLGDDGRATVRGEVHGTTKARLRIGDLHADLWLRPGSMLNVRFEPPDGRSPVSLAGTARARIELLDIDPLDINALTSDLNERLDDFLLEDLATDEVAGMQAATVRRMEAPGTRPDTTRRPPTLFVMPTGSPQRVDSFEQKLRRYYRGIDDPWFLHYLEYGVAGLRQGPRVDEKDLFERHVKGRAVHYDDPEQLRFLRSLYTELLTAFALRHHERDVLHAIAHGPLDSVKAVFARHDHLRGEDRTCELVVLDQLYLNHAHKALRRADVLRLLAEAERSSRYPEHRRIAANMLWDLTAMQPGSTLPTLRLEDPRGRAVPMDTLARGPLCLAVTASWCTYCELEMAALEKLHKEHAGIIPIAAISLDGTTGELQRYLAQHPGRTFTWLRAVEEQRLRDDLRLRALPAFFLLNDGVLVHAPAPAPSAGLGEVFHRAKVEMERQHRLKVWDD